MMTRLLQGLTLSALGIACASALGIPLTTELGVIFITIFIGYKLK